jgi:CheY-like chemotaxis protein
LVGDPVRLNQIMLNLLGNAVKFTSAGKIRVSVQLMEEDEKKVTVKFSIKDTGIGIKKEHLETIFESFQQATHETTRLFSGTGLGLSIVKQLLEPQGGHISVESELNKGSTFSFTLSFLKTKAKADFFPEIMQLDMEMKGINVLVVEDMALNQLLMKTLLDDFGFGCDIADNGKLALERLYDNPYDIILMDLQMPEMNGFEATDFIRNTMKLTIPIIALTADVTTVDLGKCKEAGMNDYIAKPINEKLLYSKMVTLLKNGVKTSTEESLKENAIQKEKCINLEYLNTRTKSNPKMIKEMIKIYLEQTPTLIQSMKTSFQSKDWKMLSSSVHKMIPSFSIMGMSPDFEEMARKVQEFAQTQLHSDSIEEMVLQLENICGQACEELEEELRRLG